MTIPEIYRGETENIIASFDFTDIAEGTGIVIFQGFDVSSGAVTFHLTESTITSTRIETGGNLTFNTNPFNLPRTVRGTGNVRFSTQYNGTNTQEAFWKVEIIHVDADGNATTIGREQTKTITSTGSIIKSSHALSIILTETLIKKGDNIRITVNPTLSGGTSVTGHDPLNREGPLITPVSTTPTKFEVFIPFKIDI